MKSLIAAAHAKGMKVFFDIITNHTADVIDYAAEPVHLHRQGDRRRTRTRAATSSTTRPIADTAALPGRWTCRRRSPTRRSSAPRPTKTVKVPGLAQRPDDVPQPRRLDLRRRELASYGDFVGLDDLFTEHPDGRHRHGGHLQGLGRLRHRRLPDRHRQAREHGVLAGVLAGDAGPRARPSGNDDFFMFGEVFDANPAFMSQYTTTGKLPATLGLRLPGHGAAASRQGKATTSCATCSPATTTTPTPTPTPTSCRPSSATTTWAGSA